MINVYQGRKAQTYPNQTVLGLELSLRCLIVVDKSKSCALSSTESGLESEGNYSFLVGLVDSSELLCELSLGDVSAVGVEDVEDELATRQQAVRDEFAGADRYRC